MAVDEYAWIDGHRGHYRDLVAVARAWADPGVPATEARRAVYREARRLHAGGTALDLRKLLALARLALVIAPGVPRCR